MTTTDATGIFSAAATKARMTRGDHGTHGDAHVGFAALFDAAGIPADGDLVLRRQDGRVTVAGRLQATTDDRLRNLYLIVEPNGMGLL